MAVTTTRTKIDQAAFNLLRTKWKIGKLGMLTANHRSFTLMGAVPSYRTKMRTVPWCFWKPIW